MRNETYSLFFFFLEFSTEYFWTATDCRSVKPWARGGDHCAIWEGDTRHLTRNLWEFQLNPYEFPGSHFLFLTGRFFLLQLDTPAQSSKLWLC